MDPRPLQSKLGQHLREKRIELAKTQAEVAEHVGLTRSSISNIEAGNQALSLHAFVELTEFLRMQPGVLLDLVCKTVSYDRNYGPGVPNKYIALFDRSHEAAITAKAGE